MLATRFLCVVLSAAGCSADVLGLNEGPACPPSCDDGDPCTVGVCVASEGCVFETSLEPGCCELQLERFGGVSLNGRGGVQGVVSQGDYAYVAAGGLGLRIIGLQSPERMSDVGWLDTPGDAVDVALMEHPEGLFAIVADSWVAGGQHSGLTVVDVRDPRNPRAVGRFDDQMLIKGVQVWGTTAYLAGFDVGVRVVDLADPRTPVDRGLIEIEETWEISVAFEKLAVLTTGCSADSPGIQLYSLEDPFAPVFRGHGSSSCYPQGVHLNETHAYAGDQGRLSVFEIGDGPDIGTIGQYEGDFGRGLYTSPNAQGVLYTAGVYKDFRVHTVEGRPRQMASLDLPQEAGPMFIEENRVLVGVGPGVDVVLNPGSEEAGAGGLFWLDITRPLQPTEVASLYRPGAAREVEVQDGHAYVAELKGGLRVYRLGNEPELVGALDLPGLEASVLVRGSRAYVGLNQNDSAQVAIVDVSSPNSPRALARLTIPGRELSMAAQEDRLYVVNRDAELFVIDVSNPEEPAILVRLESLSVFASSIAAEEGRVYVGGRDLIVLSTRGNPGGDEILEQSRVTDLYARGLDVEAGLVYATVGGTPSSLVVVDARGAPQVVGTVEVPEVGAVRYADRNAFIAGFQEGLIVVDVTEPGAPRLRASVATVSNAWGLDVEGGRIWVADELAGLQGYRALCQ